MGNTNINVPDFLKDRAKLKGLNLSEITATAIKEHLEIIEVDGSKPLVCAYCNTEGIKETAKDVRESVLKAKEAGSDMPTEFSDRTKLTWLDNYQQWICNKCLLKEINKLGGS